MRSSRSLVGIGLAALVLGSVGSPVGAQSQNPTSYRQTSPEAQSAPDDPVAVLPAGRTFRVRIDEDLNTRRVREGDRVTAILADDLYAGDVLVAEAGSEVRGRVVYVATSQETRDKAALELKFDRIYPRGGGDEIVISASVVSGEIEDRARRAERDADIAWTLGGAGIGAVIGNQSRNRSSGRATGAAIGAVTGLLISSQTGSNFTLRKGTRLTLELNRPARVY